MPNALADPEFRAMYSRLRPVGREQPQSVDWNAYGDALRVAGLTTRGIRTMTWARFSEAPLGTLTEGTSLIGVFSDGIFECLGRKRQMSREPKYRLIDFSDVKTIGAVEHAIGDHRIFTFGVEFTGYGGVLLGRLEWHAQAQRLGDNRPAILTTERERDRVLGMIRGIVAR
ncbi:hypothetical protein ACQPZX_48770 [Actinoplanes sp. CA-142083]|uniref:hypothetical protein n=1 Tax=Actinoplanes sp. CA-142083 TaxID=3239903 RepID=UPI003D9457A6